MNVYTTLTKLDENNIEEESSYEKSLLWGLLTEFLVGDSYKPRLPLSQGQPSFLLICYNPGKATKYYNFKPVSESTEYRLVNFGNAHERSTRDKEESSSTVHIDFSTLKRKGKVDSLADLLKASQPKPISSILGEEGKYSRGDMGGSGGSSQIEDQPISRSLVSDNCIGQKNALSQLIGNEKFPDFAELGLETSELRSSGNQLTPQYLEQLLMKQEKMLQTVIDLLQQRGPSLLTEQRSTVKSNNQTVSIGTNTTMRANELQQYMAEAYNEESAFDDIQANATDPFGLQNDQKQKIISVMPERPSLNKTLSGFPKSDNDSKSSRRFKDKDDTQPSPGDDSNSEKRMQVNKIRNYPDDSFSMRSSNPNNMESSSIQGRPYEKARTSKKDASMNFESSGFYQKSVTPPHPVQNGKSDYQPQFSPQITSNDRLAYGRSTEGGQSRGFNTHTPENDLRLMKGSSYQEQLGARESKYSGRRTPNPLTYASQTQGGHTDFSHITDKYSSNNFGQTQTKTWKEASPKSDPISKLSILQELEANSKACEFDNGGGKTTFEIPRIWGGYNHDTNADSDDDETRNIQHHYKKYN